MSNAANFKVFQASAGSGKTFTLIKEYLKLCLKDKASVGNYKHILAITFTNAAANEMKAKILKELCKIIDKQELEHNSMGHVLVEELGIDEKELKRNAQALLTCIMHDYSSFGVSTIDAFVQKLSRSFAHDLGLPSQYTVSIDSDEVAETITENIGLKISESNPYLTQLLIDFSKNQFDNERSTAIENQLSDFVKKLMTEKAYQKDENNNIQNEKQYKETLDFLNNKIVHFEQNIKSKLHDFNTRTQAFGLGEKQFAYGKTGFIGYLRKLANKTYEQPSTRFNTVIEQRNCLSKEGEKAMGASKDAVNAALLPILDDIKALVEMELPNFLFYRSQRDLLYLYALRVQIRKEFVSLANDDEVVHISEFNKLLNSVMGDFSVPFVYERIGEHYKHVFVDEFQDTSVLQWQNLLPLVDNGLSNSNMSMIVGDGKQSIYRFRSGEVEQIVNLPKIYAKPDDNRKAAFDEYEQNLENNFNFKNLDSNYRSFSNIVNFNNAFFEATYTHLDGPLQKVYVDEKPGTDEGVRIFQKTQQAHDGLVQIELYDAVSQPDYGLERVEALVRDLTENHGYSYADITVLVRKTEYGSEIANYLNDRGIPVISQVSILLKSSHRVQLMVCTLRYLIYDDNEPNIANLLYYWHLTQTPDFDGDVTDCFKEVKAIANGTTAIETGMGVGEAGLLGEALAKATCLYDLCASLMRIYGFDTIRDAFLNYFMEEVYKWQSGIKEGIADFLAYWDKKQNTLAVKSVSGNAVNIMTIHKSKGLEFPVVIYPEAITELDERLNASKSPEEWLRPEDLDFAAIPNLEKVLFKMDKKAENMGMKALQQVEKEGGSNRLDNLNLLYVAFTRPVQRLYVIAEQGKEGKPNIIRDFFNDKENCQIIDNDNDNSVYLYRFGNPDFMNPAKGKDDMMAQELTDSTSAEWFQKIKLDAQPTMFWHSDDDPLLPREWGELVHKVLSEIRTEKDLDAVLSPYLSDGIIDESTATWIRQRFLQMVRHPLIGAAFAPSAKIKTECEILHEGIVYRFDRYAELPEVIYLIDYKTGKKETEHKRQLDNYVSALRSMTDKEIRAHLVYLADGIEIE